MFLQDASGTKQARFDEADSTAVVHSGRTEVERQG